MITLHNKSLIPRDGFSYYFLPPGRPDAAFTIKGGTSFAPAVAALMAYRAANPWLNLPADEASCRHEIEVYTFARLLATVGVDYTMQFFTAGPEDAPEIAAREDELKKNSLNEPPKPPAAGAALVAGVKETIKDYGAGFDVIRDWLGDSGTPVAQGLAESRARTCEVCPQNQSGNWMERLAGAVAKTAIKAHIEAKNKMKLSVPNESKLFMCKACRCNLSTKVWTPIKHITKHTRPETLAKLDKRCWILSEGKE